MIQLRFFLYNISTISGIELDQNIRERLAYILHQHNNPDPSVQTEIVPSLNELQQRGDFLLYTLDAITNSELSIESRFNAASVMRRSIIFSKIPPEVIKFIKSQVEPILIPILTLSDESGDQTINAFCCLIAALVAEIANRFGSNITFTTSQSFLETTLKLLSPTNSPQNIMSALSLLEEFLQVHLEVPPDVILLFQPLIGHDIDITRQIMDVCILFSLNKCSQAIKEAIIPLFFANIDNIPAIFFVKLINLVGTTLLNLELSGQLDEIDQAMITFIIKCMSEQDTSKSVPAMLYFEKIQKNIGFIPEATLLLYGNLPNDDGSEESDVVRGCQLALTKIAKRHQQEMLPFLTTYIKQDLQTYISTVSSQGQPTQGMLNEAVTALKRALRGITTIEKFIENINELFQSISTLLPTPMRKEAILTLESIGLDHPELYDKVLPIIFPFIAFLQSDNIADTESSHVRMQSMRTLTELLMKYDNPIPFQPFIGFISQMLEISIKLASPPLDQLDEIMNALPLIGLFINNVESFSFEEIHPILTYTIENFVSRPDDDILSLDLITILHSIVSKITSLIPSQEENQQVQSIQFVLSILQAVHPKCLEHLNKGDEDPMPCFKILYLYYSLFSLISNQCAGSFASTIIGIISIIIPKLGELLGSSNDRISNQAWEFASDILRSFPDLFKGLLEPAVSTVLSLEEHTEPGLLGNMALVFYDLCKLNIVNVSLLSEENFEHFIDVFSFPLEQDITFITQNYDEVDMLNISLFILRLCAMTKLPISVTCYQNAQTIVQTLDPSLTTLIEEVKQLVAEIEQAQSVKPDDSQLE